MNRQVMRVVAGANLVAGCLLLQGCSMFGKKTEEQTVTTVPDPVPVEVVPAEPIPVEVAPVPELPIVQTTTPYTIQKGDTITSVAYKYNLRWQDVVAVNPGITPTRLRIGQVIQLPGQVDLGKVRAPSAAPKVTAPKTAAPKAAAPAGATVTYTVVAGDSLSVIAHKHGVKTAAIREANGLTSDRINVGQKLKIPGATKSAAASAAKKDAAVAAPKVEAPKTAAPKPPVAKPVAEVAAPPAPTTVESEPVKVETAAPPPAPVVDANVQTYTVKEGEDLYAVAIRWGVSPSDLKALNNLTSTELKAGTVLKIPGGVQ